MSVIILQGPRLYDSDATAIAVRLGGTLQSTSSHWRITTPHPMTNEQLAALRATARFDINRLPDVFDPNNVRLLVTDMDSTFINIECIDEIADFASLKAQVAAITQASMRGDLRFEESLTRRTQLLAGLDEAVLEKVYNERLQLNAGGETMLAGLKQNGIRIGLVSGGFTFFTERLKQRYQLDYTLANVLDIVDGKLTGTVIGAIVGAEAKADFLLKVCNELRIQPNQAVAVGDGANDLPMMRQAGLSIAFHAKPKVQEQADVIINYCGLEGVLGILDIPVPT